MKIGFAGIGLMGLPMCERLLQAGHTIHIWNRSPEKTLSLQAKGAQLVNNPVDLATESDVVFLCLFDAKAVENVVFGDQGLLKLSTKQTKIIVDHSSISPQQTKKLASRLPQDWQWIDAPVSGGTAGAANGTLAIMAGGEASAIKQVTPIMQAYAAQITHMGQVGAGQVTKLCNQTIVTATIGAIAEAISLAQDADVDATRLIEALKGGWADSILLQIFVERMHHLPSQATATVQTMLKDLNTIAGLAQEQGTAMPISHATQQLYQLASRHGLADQDVSHLIQILQGKS